MVALLAGCVDENAHQQAKAREEFTKAVALVRDAQVGYVPKGQEPAGADGKTSHDLQQFRQNKLAEASKALTALLNSGPDSQKAAVRRLLADIEASASRYQARAALTQWTDISRRSGHLIFLLSEVDRAASRAGSFNPDARTPLINSFKDRTTAAERKLADEQLSASGLQPKINELTAQRDKLKSDGEAQIARAQALRDEAFVAEGDEQVKLHDQADTAERTGQKAIAASREAATKLELFENEMKIVAKQIELAKEALDQLSKQASVAEKAQAQTRGLRDAAVSDQAAAVDALVKELAETSKDFAQIETGFTSAEDHAAKATDHLKQALGSEKGLAQFELLSRQINRIDILTQHQMALDTFRRTLDTIAGQTERLMPGRTVFAEAARSLQERQDAVSNSLSALIGESLGLASELATTYAKDDANTPDLNEADYVKTIQARLQHYSALSRGVPGA